MADLQTKSKADQEKLLQESRERLRHLRFEAAVGRVKNVREMGHIRKTIAQILTLWQRNNS